MLGGCYKNQEGGGGSLGWGGNSRGDETSTVILDIHLKVWPADLLMDWVQDVKGVKDNSTPGRKVDVTEGESRNLK